MTRSSDETTDPPTMIGGIPVTTSQLKDNTGAPVTISLDESGPIGAYYAHFADGTLAARADFIDAPDVDGERVLFHTEVEHAFTGRGLGGLLVRAALADSIRKDLTVVPVCPLFAAHLQQRGVEFLADRGRFRQPTRADIVLVRRAVAGVA